MVFPAAPLGWDHLRSPEHEQSCPTWYLETETIKLFASYHAMMSDAMAVLSTGVSGPPCAIGSCSDSEEMLVEREFEVEVSDEVEDEPIPMPGVPDLMEVEGKRKPSGEKRPIFDAASRHGYGWIAEVNQKHYNKMCVLKKYAQLNHEHQEALQEATGYQTT